MVVSPCIPGAPWRYFPIGALHPCFKCKLVSSLKDSHCVTLQGAAAPSRKIFHYILGHVYMCSARGSFDHHCLPWAHVQTFSTLISMTHGFLIKYDLFRKSLTLIILLLSEALMLYSDVHGGQAIYEFCLGFAISNFGTACVLIRQNRDALFPLSGASGISQTLAMTTRRAVCSVESILRPWHMGRYASFSGNWVDKLRSIPGTESGRGMKSIVVSDPTENNTYYVTTRTNWLSFRKGRIGEGSKKLGQ